MQAMKHCCDCSVCQWGLSFYCCISLADHYGREYSHQAGINWRDSSFASIWGLPADQDCHIKKSFHPLHFCWFSVTFAKTILWAIQKEILTYQQLLILVRIGHLCYFIKLSFLLLYQHYLTKSILIFFFSLKKEKTS